MCASYFREIFDEHKKITFYKNHIPDWKKFNTIYKNHIEIRDGWANRSNNI
jgi:hypothetical protein